TLRVPVELKSRLEHEAKQQGVSLNNLANYFLTTQLSQREALSMLEARISKKNITQLKSKVQKILAAVPKRKAVPEWDRIK
ncbi:MAG: toxin-antitoxin system HicB family antitoxin, partial [Gammaproteobacteria bacterium]|nr:toxin-antitoxin system HicB family antitoxin [Gammaproteobacteria bacterium]